MPRPSQIDDQRKRLLPIVTAAFSELGFQRTTTSELARRCEVRENILYRLWSDKKAMFLAAVAHVFQSRESSWNDLVQVTGSAQEAVETLVRFESEHLGESAFYRVVFSGLAQADDPDIRKAVARMYRQFHRRICELIENSRSEAESENVLDVETMAWSIMGVATVTVIAQELSLLSSAGRKSLFRDASGFLLAGG